MRRTITLLTALALVFAASCQRIEETTVQDGSVSDEQITIEATIAETNPSAAVPGDELQTKTALQENGVDIWWTPGDAINLFYGTANAGKFQTENKLFVELPRASLKAIRNAETVRFRFYYEGGQTIDLPLNAPDLEYWKAQLQ